MDQRRTQPKEPVGSDWLWYPQQTVASGVGAAGSTIRFADLNGDGRADYLKVNADSSVQAWINGGPNPRNRSSATGCGTRSRPSQWRRRGGQHHPLRRPQR
ncbi:hypothetical protein GCM10023238_36920 [Streptomyces heliomycini]